MKKILILLSLFCLSSLTSFAAVEDTQVVDKLTPKQELKIDFNLKTFKSCENLESVMGKYIKDYYKKNKGNFPTPYSVMEDGALLGGIEAPSSPDLNKEIAPAKTTSTLGSGKDDFTKTNTQVNGVDESEIVKTDGKYIYYFNDKDHFIYVVNSSLDKLEVVKKIKLPDTFYNPTMYLGENRLIVVASGYSSYDYSRYGYWVNRNSKTYSIIFDTSDINNPKLLKLNVSDGDLSQSRKIGDYLYLVSNNSFNIPYYNILSEKDIVVDSNKIIPKNLELTRTDNSADQNLKLKGTKYPYSLKAGNTANCDEIEYVLPDEGTLGKYDFQPSYNIITVINTKDYANKVKTTVIAGSNTNLYMSLNNLYLTSYLYSQNDFACPIGAMCMMPYYSSGENTLLHKIAIKGDKLTYTKSNILPGIPLNQYSMDENFDNFRIVTQKYYPERQTSVYILDKDLRLLGELDGLGKTEDFKSSRFIGDKLFLVTFKQIDPLFAIDLSDVKNPKVIGELKIPGYSTYLHPYDENHLIGIGYNTITNQWGGTVNDGVKIDLYELNYNKKCGDVNLSADEKAGCDKGDYKGVIVKQKYTLTLGQNGSYSEALNNPRMFNWNFDKKLLLLPASLYKNNGKDYYNYTDFYNGLFAISIDNNSGIKEKYRITHIKTNGLEEKRTKDCSQYANPAGSGATVCHKVIGGGEYCEPSSNTYVPKYCYADSTIGEYLASFNYDYVNSFIKRGLWIGDNVFSISNDKIGVNKLLDGAFIKELEMK